MKDLGYDTYSDTYEDIVGKMLDEVSELRLVRDEKEEERFERELKRLMKPTN